LNILLINHYAGSPRDGMEFRPYYLAREWQRLGHRVLIVASSESHVRARQPDVAGRLRMDETIGGVDYTWLRTPAYAGNGVGRVRNMFAFVRALYREGRQIARSFQPDLVIASSTYPMDIWPARRIARLAGARLVFEVHDLWPLSPMELGGMSPRHPFIMLVQAAEDYAYRRADLVVSMLPKVRSYMESRGMAPHKLHIVPNGVDPAEWHAAGPALPPAVADTLAALRRRGLAVVGYAGAHGVANALDTLLDAAHLMKDDPVAFVLVGGGPAKHDLQQRARAEGLHNVCFIEPTKKETIPALLRCFDIAYIGLQRQPLFRFGIAPNKLTDYMMAARPVLLAIEAGNDPVADAGCGLTITPEDPLAVAQGVRRLLAYSADERQTMGERGRKFVLENHTYAVLAQRFLAACAFDHDQPAVTQRKHAETWPRI
jgi:glycosyltransferase involved in cell wall biosynthesis